MQSIRFLAALAACLVQALPAQAQMSANPPEIGEGVRAFGDKLGPDVVKGVTTLYRPLHEAASKEGVKVEKDLAYGNGERQKLDLYIPSTLPEGAKPPVLVFAHGGGFVRGDKKDVSHFGYYFAQHGIVTALINYGFAPQARFPAGGEDVGKAVAWLRTNSSAHPGDTRSIFVSGNSAGATHAATFGFVTSASSQDDGVRGLILISIPTADAEDLAAQDKVYYGEDASQYPQMSIIRRIADRKLPVFLAVAENDMPSIQRQNKKLVDALFNRDSRLPVYKTALGHNHISIIEHFGTADESLGPDILEFIRQNRTK
ncbi:alpha/beta hydrolase [Rhizobium rhizoryzae]|uniref:Acetyl esterase/lipase n=2 Tax=Rhizobium rhizoryzae TaxID=451876 RepID=A0A7W6PT90_9HYPH|nr:alpha/beta hydrolase [Rhizobium rhizoryzae]MBB4144912.1 acetyl esterase/lipase [Rhizobium rhizoryzae]